MTVESSVCEFSPERYHRYSLRHSWEPELGTVAFIGLNPSTADESELDPTLRRCVGFAKEWGYGELVMLNLFSYRSTDPKGLVDPGALSGPAAQTGADLIDRISRLTAECGLSGRRLLLVAAWGKGPGGGPLRGIQARIAGLQALLVARFPLRHLGLNGNGTPKHPLYLRGDLKPMEF